MFTAELNYLIKQQRNGLFPSLSSPDPSTFNNAIMFQSIFSTAIILELIAKLPKSPQVEEITTNAAMFLLAQRSKYWSWNYWFRKSPESKRLPYPDDLDDTFCAATALFHYKKGLISPSVLAKLVTLLTMTEIEPGGPYKTWIVDNEQAAIWKDVDIAVNSNIAYFLHLQGIQLPKLTNYFTQAIIQKTITSPYYPSSLPIIYFLSRFYNGEAQDVLKETILKTKQKNVLDTALILLSLSNLRVSRRHIEPYMEQLMESRSNWSKPYPFYTGVNPKKTKKFYGGSQSLTLAFCLAATTKWQQSNIYVSKDKNSKTVSLEKGMYEKLTNSFRFLPQISYQQVSLLLASLEKTETSSPIALLPYNFAKALKVNNKKISSELIEQLGIANVLGWLAYTIFDEIVDEQQKKDLVFVGTIAMRRFITIYQEEFSKNIALQKLVYQTLDTMDYANIWELSHCSTKDMIPDFQDYAVLSQKSYGHALGPIAILMQAGYTASSKELLALKTFFKHFLIAKQLHDDAHDVFDDLSKGYINPIGALLLQRFPQYTTPQLRRVFWNEVIDDVCLTIDKHIKQANMEAIQLSTIIAPSFFTRLLNPISKGTKDALRERKRAQKFLISL